MVVRRIRRMDGMYCGRWMIFEELCLWGLDGAGGGGGG